MQSGHSADDILDFLSHAGERGLMPAATAAALAVAVRNVFSVLDEAEKANLPLEDIDGVIRRFNNKRARDFNPASLKEYGRRVRRAVDLYIQWKEDPANFTVKTRATYTGKKEQPAPYSAARVLAEPLPDDPGDASVPPNAGAFSQGGSSGYQTAFPVRQGQVVVVSNIPYDLTPAEAERLAQFIRLLAPSQS